MSDEKMCICSAHEFHVMKEHEKINYLTKVGPDGCELLYKNQVQEIAAEVHNRASILKQHVTQLDESCNHQKNLFADEVLSKHKWANKKMIYRCVNNKQNRIFQFDIFNCELGENIGSEKNKTRPVIILSKYPINSQTVLIAPITTTEIKNGIPLKHTKNSKVKGFIDFKQLRTVDKNRLTYNFIDRLLNEDEYKALSSELGKTINPLQTLIRKKISALV